MANLAGDASEQEQRSSSLGTLVVYSLSIIVVCLSIFNLYLFHWVWSSLSGNGVTDNSAPEAPARTTDNNNKRPSIDLLGSWQAIKFNEKLASLHSFQADQVIASLSQSNERRTTNAAATNELSHQQPDYRPGHIALASTNSVQLTTGDMKLLEFSAHTEQLNFANGLVVVSPNYRHANKQNNKPALVCCARTDTCEIRSPLVKMSHENGVDFDRKSVQATRIVTTRIHSPTNALRLLAHSDAKFIATNGAIQLQALDGIALSSRNSAVIFDAKTINVASLTKTSSDLNARFADAIKRTLGKNVTHQPRTNTRYKRHNKLYKLCVCLVASNAGDSQQRQQQQQREMDPPEVRLETTQHEGIGVTPEVARSRPEAVSSSAPQRTRHGLVFAVRIDLNCIKFSAFCRTS